MSQYPVILVPRAIAQAKEAIPPIPSFHEQPPQHPGGEPQRVNSDLVVGSGAIVAIVSIVAAIAHSPGVGLTLLVLEQRSHCISGSSGNRIPNDTGGGRGDKRSLLP